MPSTACQCYRARYFSESTPNQQLKENARRERALKVQIIAGINIRNNTGDTISLEMDKLGKRSGFRRNNLVRSWQPATTPVGQPASAPSVSLGSTQPRRAVVAQPATRARAAEQAALQQDQVQQDRIWREAVEAEQKGRKIW